MYGPLAYEKQLIMWDDGYINFLDCNNFTIYIYQNVCKLNIYNKKS
jgi:hypothetical protein